MRNVSLRQMRMFAEVARQSSFTRAAATMHVTAPAVTMQVKDLEAAVGLVLFDRRGRRVSLTAAGDALLVHVRRMLSVVKDAEDAMARLKRVEEGTLHVGLVSTAKYFVPRLLGRFRALHPAVEMRLTVMGNREQLVSLLTDNEIDLAIMGRPPREVATQSKPFAAHPTVLVCGPGHPLEACRRVPATTVATLPFLARESGSGTRKAMEDWFDAHRCKPSIAMEMSSNETIKQAAMAGMGVSLLSLHTVGLELSTGLLRVLRAEDTPIMRTWFVVYLASKLLSPAAEAFQRYVIEEADPFLRAHDEPLLMAAFGAKVAKARADADIGTRVNESRAPRRASRARR